MSDSHKCSACGDQAAWLAPRTTISATREGAGGLWTFYCERHYKALPHRLGILGRPLDPTAHVVVASPEAVSA